MNFNCLHCSKDFQAIAKGAKYCSKSCAAIVNNKLHPKREKGFVSEKELNRIPKPKEVKIFNCLFCNVEVERNQNNKKSKYCSVICSTRGTAKIREEMGLYKTYKPGTLMTCLQCKKETIRTEKHRSTTFCSVSCSSSSRKVSFEDAKTDRARKARLIESTEYKCTKCGIFDWCGDKLMLELDHIDGNSENNSKENLRLLCPNCHSQTDTYRAKNKGKGRRKYYYERRDSALQ